MSDYSTILLAIDLTDEAHNVAAKAISLREINGASLHLVYVVEPLYFTDLDTENIQRVVQKQAEESLANFADRYKIPAENVHLCQGRPQDEIHRLVNDINADLVVVGSHGRHGLSLLLGSTANGVLHGSTCDVLAVRVGANKKDIS